MKYVGDGGKAMTDTCLLRDAVTHSIDKLTAEGKTAGCAVRVMLRGETVLSCEFGLSDIGAGTPLRADSVFRLASMTKPIVAAAVLLCEQRGLLSLGDRLSDHLSEFSHMYVAEYGKLRPPLREMTLLDLLSHTAGFGTDVDAAELDAQMTAADAKCSRDSALRFCAECARLAFDPGSRRAYSPTAAFDLLAAAVERASGRKFEDFVRDNIFLPLGMHDTSFELTDTIRARLVAMHDRKDGRAVTQQTENIFTGHPLSYHCGGAGLVSTADDYLRFAEMLRIGTVRDTAVLSRSSVLRMCTPVCVPADAECPPDEVFGCGVRVTLHDRILPHGCFGWSGAYGTHFWVDPKNELVAVLMRNSLYDGGAGSSIARRFERDVMTALAHDCTVTPCPYPHT